ncbi:transposase [Polymorphospora rubra]|uniref:transposase n=1 Tax=Polymorphospora rubra TaxID=338584 RepID=UPI0031CEBDAC
MTRQASHSLRRHSPSFVVRSSICSRPGRSVAELVRDLEISDQTIYNWRRQELIDTGQVSGVTSADQAELVAARRRIAELETELAVHRRAAELLKEVVPPKDRYAVIKRMAAEGLPVEVCGGCCRYPPPGTTPGVTGHRCHGRCVTSG